MSEAVIVAGVRTPVGTAYKGSLAGVSAFDLAHTVLAALIQRTGIDPALVDDVVLAESMYGGGVTARHAAVTTGLVGIPGLAVNRHCAGGLSALTVAAGSIAAGMQDVVIAGGVNSQSTSPRGSWRNPATGETLDPWLPPPNPDTPTEPAFDMPLTVGWNAAVEVGISRNDLDEWALESHRKAIAAIDDGRLAQEIVPVEIDRGEAGVVLFDTDEHPRRGSTLEKLASLAPLRPAIDGFSITAGNSAGLNDAAAVLLVMSPEKAKALGYPVLATIKSWSSVGVEPARTGMAPVTAIPKALERIGRTVGDVDLWEINEAFASVPVAAVRKLGLDPATVNPVGSGCSIGHPISASGARMVLSLVKELGRRGGGTGVASMCAAGGMGSALVLDVEPA